MVLRFQEIYRVSLCFSASVNSTMTELKTYVRAHKRPSPPSPPEQNGRRRSVRRRRQEQPLPPPETPVLVEGERAIGGDIEDFGEEEIRKIRASQLGWYDRNHRELPWRRNPNEDEKDGVERESRAYGVWVSELMLQQTRVQTVIDYYNRWMRKWPTIHHLAQASLEEVNEMWAGLGYYRRARFLLEGAKMIVAEGGGFPKTVSALRKVPGIGEYTAGAVASIAFKEVVPVVDGNVVRVLSRLKAISANPKDKTTVKGFWKLATQVVDPLRPGDFNQSLMELGATICTPLNPSCSSCPIATQCHALSISKRDKSVLVTDYPSKVVKVKQRHEFSAVCVVEILGSECTLEGNRADSRFLLVKRPDGGLLAGLWEFPSVMVDDEAEVSTRRKAVDSFLKKTFKLDPGKTCSVASREHVGEFVHIFSHIRLKIHVELLVIRLKGDMSYLLEQGENTIHWKCVDGNTLSTIGLTSGVRKVHNLVQKFKASQTGVVQVREKPNSKKHKLS